MDRSFDEIMVRLRSGDNEAAARVFNKFVKRLIGLARSRLDKGLGRKVDPEDIVQSVYKSFFRRHAAGEFDFSNWDRLWGLLAVIAVRKCKRQMRAYRRAR